MATLKSGRKNMTYRMNVARPYTFLLLRFAATLKEASLVRKLRRKSRSKVLYLLILIVFTFVLLFMIVMKEGLL